jgi:hypothetical protein
MRWQLLLEEYGPELIYIKGENNIVADALSCLELVEEPTLEELPKEEAGCLQDTSVNWICQQTIHCPTQKYGKSSEQTDICAAGG